MKKSTNFRFFLFNFDNTIFTHVYFFIYRHRIPKTNFIFDPREGLLLLEQKLPMPWHAFNRTPDFTEVPEYKVVKDLVDTWFLSNTSFMSYYYAYKQYMDIYTLIPPFTGKINVSD